MGIRFDEIGQRLRAYRMGKALTADDIAERLGVSRAAVYRIEGGEVVKIETLERLSVLLDTSVASLLGVGTEYYSSSTSYFERMRQVEEQSDQVVAYFSPVSYLLTSEAYAGRLKQTLLEAIPFGLDDRSGQEAEINAVISILNERKEARRHRRLSVINFVNLPEIERWLKIGAVGRFDLSPDELVDRRRAARAEVEHLIKLIESEPMFVQIAVMKDALPNVTFQLFRSSNRTLLGLSPFRLGGELPNVRTGVAMLTGDDEPVRLYEQLVDELWGRAYKGGEAAAKLRAVIERSAA